jgi:hypothetical protein
MNRLTHCVTSSVTATQALRLFYVAALSLTMIGCANLQTISRRTEFPKDNESKAIHLDAQQRLVLIAGKQFCAEPSPDALASYASALGFGFAGADRNSASFAGALQGTAASIGLRTQSITLMRDSLYRLCEAHVNGAVNPLQAAEFLRRSQDLTAVVLAIEQLTGAVVASQVVLTSSAASAGAAQLQSNQEALNTARTEQTEAKKALDAAEETLVAATAEVEPKKKSLAAAQKEKDDLPADATDAQKAEADQKIATATEELDDVEDAVETATDRRDDASDRLNDARRVVEIIEEARDSSMADASAETSGDGDFETLMQPNNMTPAETRHVANAVENMVKAALSKDYSLDTCLNFLTLPENATAETRSVLKEASSVREACLVLISAHFKTKAKGMLSEADFTHITDAAKKDNARIETEINNLKEKQ